MSSKTKTIAKKEEATLELVPKLRFPGFRGSEGWKPVALGEASTPVTERVGKRKLTPVSISAGIGFVPQAEKFGRDISGNQYQLYTLVRDGDFVFNKGNSLKFPQGCVYQLKGWGEVAAPNVFICFRLKKGFSDRFFQQCFEQNQHGRQLKRHITSGARSNGLLNISKETFFGVEVPTPSPAEQQKIAECLSSVDELMAAQARKVDALKTHKKGLMQQLFPREGETQPRLRFPEFRKAGDWVTEPLGSLCRIRTGKKDANEGAADGVYPFFTCAEKHIYSHSYSFEAEAILIAGNANVGQTRYYNGKFEAYQRTYVLTDFEGIFTPYLYSVLNANLRPDLLAQVQTSAMSYIRLPMLEEYQINAPPSQAEQQRIATCLSSLDALISAETQKLEALKIHKKGLMQQLFPSPDESAV